MKVIQQILKKLGYADVQDLELGENITLERAGFEPLVIERVSMVRVSVMHYFEQNCDLMRDPEAVFEVNDGWSLVEYRDDTAGIHRFDDADLSDEEAFVEQWNENLRKQGFVDAAEELATQRATE